MKILIKTKRLIIRTPLLSDAAEVTKAVHESHPQLSKWMPWAQKKQTLQQIKANLRLAIKLIKKGTEIRLLAFSRENGDLVVSSGMHDVDWKIPKISTGYWVRTKYQGKGYVTETVNAIVKYAKANIKPKRIEITAAGRNIKSKYVAKSCGFKLEAVLKSHRINYNNQIDDTCIYSYIFKANRN
jgi:ribosomal-protein-serine acetyltransferase